MARSTSKTTVTGLDPRFAQLGVSVEFDDGDSTVAGVVRVVLGGGVALTSAGLAAVVAQANTYLTAGKYTSITATGATPLVHVTPAGVVYSCLAADSAAQIAALTALATAANVVQTAVTIR